MQDTLMYVKRLEAAGISRIQAEAQVEIMTEFADAKFATKHDLKDQTAELRLEIHGVRSDLSLEIKNLEIRIGRMFVVSVTVIIAAMGLMLKF